MTQEKEVIYRAASIIGKSAAFAALAYTLYELCSGRCPETSAACVYLGAFTAENYNDKTENF